MMSHRQQVTYLVPQSVLDDSRAFLYMRGQIGCEGTALWVGRPSGNVVTITRLFVPDQVCFQAPTGVAVYLTEEAHYTLTDNLDVGERFYIRIHSHPAEAYHSETDDANGVITHQGAISVVVPYFALEPIDLAHCAIFRLEHGKGWLPISSDEVAGIFRIVS